MPPKRVVVSNSAARPQKGFLGTIYDEATSPENTTIVRSILVFGVRLHNSQDLYGVTQLTCLSGWCRFPPQQLRRISPPSVSRHFESEINRPGEPD